MNLQLKNNAYYCQHDYLYINPLKAELNPICHLLALLGDLTFMGPCIVSIFQYISNKMQRYTVYLYLETALHISGGTSIHHQERIVSTVSGIFHTVTATCRYRGRVGTGLSVTQTSSNSSTIAADSSNGVTNTRCCRYYALLMMGGSTTRNMYSSFQI